MTSTATPTPFTTTASPMDANDPPPTLRPYDHFLLHFADSRQIFAQAIPKSRHKSPSCKTYPPCKINKRTYATHNLIGLPYGTVLEVTRDGLLPLPEGQDLLPDEEQVREALLGVTSLDGDAATTTHQSEMITASQDSTLHITPNDNRNIHDTNTSQTLTQQQVTSLLSTGTDGCQIVAALISNSSTFASKTAFSQAKYLKRKQMKYMPRCRIVRVTPESLCSAMHAKDSRRICNLRSDTLGYILSSANVSAGQRVLVMDTAVQGILSAAVTRRMGGYGSVLALFEGQQPSYLEVVQRMNLNVMERQSLKWVGMGEVFGSEEEKRRQVEVLRDESGNILDVEKRDREGIQWPCPLMSHTRNYLLNEVKEERKIKEFLDKRCSRFARKLTRLSMLELREFVASCKERDENGNSVDSAVDTTMENDSTTNSIPRGIKPNGNSGTTNPIRQCDSIIIATKYDPTITILRLLPYLAPSCPFVIFHEFLEPLLETFRTLQNYGTQGDNSDPSMPMMCRRNIAINLRLTDTWFREYQVLEGRTHPNMTMSQNGGYLLMGTKLCPKTGTNEMDPETVRMLRAKMGPTRRPKKGGKEKGGEKKDGSGGNDKRKSGGEDDAKQEAKKAKTSS
ncbi:hypothetical protein HJC23_006843 [Cyclotella cryptica]|uniref:tRNA (adenine(58)-N(1))-methyltransferase non-catalytic subunit TRM6 n=1 Tax=Cyclotella cryptica TaxID=29204 RepID=A0ABD3PG30_9STRA|eukprot:CCRYP_015089-RA/>CCRYP_015089-RA protein AED:0.00 eAED:0.00 QI:64/-1/1/1/-1/1/1/220/622